ncbi:hypothetical protein SAMN02745126_00947 [Enhydrobacter aerosaccus]|uniref:Alpha/beta hydrolase family protein n=1 Tax=Enhydrobacter aerosaccus TaxID=225324 RepID=A0A1T4KG04_9HYPH|nr:hypothetical protein [Enhydrobacter aerosaccus]SJZ41378.1 hypothetical protein SAMN02745126_00947 [Enhydrobacter aerosaccus]
MRIVIFLFAMIVAIQAHAGESVLTLTPRPGAVLRVLTDRPANPVGSVILLAGADGILDLDAQGHIGTSLRDNEVIRTRASYVKAGYATFAPDVASDLRGTQGFRFGSSYAADLGAVVGEARKLGVPVAVIGTSRGAISIAALLLKQSAALPDAAVISSGVLMADAGEGGSASTVGDVGRIHIPILLLRHVQDSCPVSRPEDADRFKALLVGAPKVDIVTLNGGGPATRGADRCGSSHFHGFYGIDDQVVAATVTWLRANMRR